MSDFFDEMTARREADDGSISLITVGSEHYGPIYFPNGTYLYDEQERKYVVHSDDGMMEFNRDKVVFVSTKRVSREELEEILKDAGE